MSEQQEKEIEELKKLLDHRKDLIMLQNAVIAELRKEVEDLRSVALQEMNRE